MKHFYLLLLVSLYFKAFPETRTAEVPLFDKKIPVAYDHSIVFSLQYKPNEEGYFETYYHLMDTSKYNILLNDLQKHREELALNDWLYFLLLKNSIGVILSGQKEYAQTLFLWFMLNKSGFETRLEFIGKEITVSVFTNNLVYDVPQSKGKGGFYLDLTAFSNKIDYNKWIPFRLDFNPNKGKEVRPFSFKIPSVALNGNGSEEMPLPRVFESRIVEKEISFSYNGKSFHVVVPVDIGYASFLKKYPELSVLRHTDLALSPGASKALVTFLKQSTAGLDSVQKIRFLMSFCRTGFSFTPLKKSNGSLDIDRSKVINSPEETLLDSTVESEDISILFYYLAKEILNPEMVFLKFGKQISVAVNLNRKLGPPIFYNNKIFAICDVSENEDSTEIGIFPKSISGKSPSFIDK